MKDFYFSHDYHASQDEKIIKLIKELGWEGYGLYWGIIERLHKEGGWLILDFDTIAFDMRTHSERIANVVQGFNLFQISDNKFTTDRVLLNISKQLEKSQKARESAQISWIKRDRNHANAKRALCDRYAKKEIKRKEIKETNTYAEQVQQVFAHFCLVMHKKILLSPERHRIIENRLKEGRTVEEMNKAINNFSKDDWPDRHKYSDIKYAVGINNKIDNLDRWLNTDSKEKVMEGF